MANQVKSPATFLANAALSAFRAVSLSNNRGVDYSATAVVPFGWTQADTAISEYVTVSFFSKSQTHKAAVSGAPITAGDYLFGGADGYMVRTGGTISVCKALQSATVNGSIIEVAAVT